MENIKPLLVLLTCDFKNEKLSALLKDIVQTFPNTDHEHTKQIRIVNCADIFQSTAEDAPLPAEEAVKKLKTIMKPPKHEHDVSVYLLYDYPISVAHLVGLIDNSKEYSILDGVVKLVANTSGTVKR